MAEEMNGRGAMELAVPFYRQALALLMAERQQRQAPLAAEQLHGLLEAAQHWEQGQTTPAAGHDLETTIRELSEELSSDTAEQVLAGLAALETEHGALPASGLDLRGKACIVLGQLAAATAAFAAACEADPSRVESHVNHGGALLAVGQTSDALLLLRQTYQLQQGQVSGPVQIALLRNLAAAEALEGRLAAVLGLQRQWFALEPNGQAPQQWLHWALEGLRPEQDAEAREAALALLQDLHQSFPDERSVSEALAAALEADGRYREASLLYRSLLRPSW